MPTPFLSLVLLVLLPPLLWSQVPLIWKSGLLAFAAVLVGWLQMPPGLRNTLWGLEVLILLHAQLPWASVLFLQLLLVVLIVVSVVGFLVYGLGAAAVMQARLQAAQPQQQVPV